MQFSFVEKLLKNDSKIHSFKQGTWILVILLRVQTTIFSKSYVIYVEHCICLKSGDGEDGTNVEEGKKQHS